MGMGIPWVPMGTHGYGWVWVSFAIPMGMMGKSWVNFASFFCSQFCSQFLRRVAAASEIFQRLDEFMKSIDQY